MALSEIFLRRHGLCAVRGDHAACRILSDAHRAEDSRSERARDGALIPLAAALVEFGAGSSKKARIMLRAAPQIAAYVPVDISGEFLAQEAAALKRDMLNIAVLPVAADFTRDFDLPAQVRSRPRVGFFPGSTIGNFEPQDAAEFLRQARRILGAGSTMIVGVDFIKDAAVLNGASDSAPGGPPKFNPH